MSDKTHSEFMMLFVTSRYKSKSTMSRPVLLHRYNSWEKKPRIKGLLFSLNSESFSVVENIKAQVPL